VRDLGDIIVDEEHDGSYKQSDAPRYHARDVAIVRARSADALCVLGSATPSLESWRNAETGKFNRLSLPERVGGRPLPPVEVVDLRASSASTQGGAPAQTFSGVLSERLTEAVRLRLERREQAILLLNRRGYSAFVQCRSCGEVSVCPNCSVSLTFHRARRRLLCHHCRYEEEEPTRCHACGGQALSFRGLGTEQVERVVTQTFPGARIARMDVDTTSGRWAHQEILARVERGEVDLLLGTQMIAKGLDLPRVTLVGVVNADVGIHLPDFRARERTFQLLSQVAGRAGRGPLGGEVIIQTALPQHYAIQAALRHDMAGFARRELGERRNPVYPPWVRLVNVVVSSPDPELAAEGVEVITRWSAGAIDALEAPAPQLVGPAPSPIERLHGRWRWHFFLRGGGVQTVTQLLRRLLREVRMPSGDVRISIDRDPVALL
jgi:primosomal protein N' (replication factor Y)